MSDEELQLQTCSQRRVKSHSLSFPVWEEMAP